MTNFTVTADVGKQMTEEVRKQGDEIKKMMDAPPKSEAPAPASEPSGVAPPSPAPEPEARAHEETKA